MTPAQIPATMQQAVAHHQAGRFAQAEQLYRQVLAADPRNADALHLLGVLALQFNNAAAAIDLITQAIAIRPSVPDFHLNLGNAYKAQQRTNDAIASFQATVKLAPNLPEAHSSLGTALRLADRLDEALAAFNKAIQLRPNFPEALVNAAVILQSQKKHSESIPLLQRAAQIKPNLPEAHYNLGASLLALERHADAAAAFQRTIDLRPDHFEAIAQLGHALHAQGKFDEAIAACRRAIQLRPDFDAAHHHLGLALRDKGNLEEAVSEFRRALELNPNSAETHCDLGNALHRQGLVDQGLAEFRTTLSLNPDLSVAWGSLLFALHYDPAQTPQQILADHKSWNDRVAAPFFPHIRTHTNDRSPDRKLRIGYVSPDFRKHAVSFFIEPILANHDPENFQVYLYSNAPIVDHVTKRLQSLGHEWRSIYKITDDRAAEMMREDKIDILVDLAVHTFGNRLLLFARKPAPVQITYLGYAATTGLSTIDYRITDPHVDPPGQTESFGTEKLLRLPETLWCYRPPDNAPPLSESPFARNGRITFGSANILAKISPAMMQTWAAILAQVPNSRLALKSASFDDESARARIRNIFASHNVDPSRIDFSGWGDMDNYLAFLSTLDIVLDTFPFNGGTTTCHALWMGVPPIVLQGITPVSRVGNSILTNLNLPDLISTTPDDYNARAVSLAHDTARLSNLRSTMRERMQSSPLMNAPSFTRNLESAYRSVWRSSTSSP